MTQLSAEMGQEPLSFFKASSESFYSLPSFDQHDPYRENCKMLWRTLELNAGSSVFPEGKTGW